MLPDTDEIVNEFNRQQLKKDWLDIIIDKDGQDSDKNSDDKHNKINELLDIYWEY